MLATSRTDPGPSISSLPSLMWQPYIASYSDWDERQKDQLGGIEYRALKTLWTILMCYFILFHILGIVLLAAWIWLTPEYGQSVTVDGVNTFWWAIFTAGSAFNDLGFTLTPDSMGFFKNAAFPLILMTFLIVLGNTGFPCMLRLIIWLLSKLAAYGSSLSEELQFLLDHSRRCFTLLFPSGESWRLLGVLILLNGFDFTVFCTLSDVSATGSICRARSLIEVPSCRDLSTKRTTSLSLPLFGSSTACFRLLRHEQPASRSHHLQTFILPFKYRSS